MTSEIILTSGGTSVTVYTTRMEEIRNNQLIKLAFPQTVVGQAPKDNKIADFLRITRLFNVQGFIDSSSRANLSTLFNVKGVIVLTYNTESINVNVEKMSVTETPGDGGGVGQEPNFYDVQMSLIVGENLTS